MAIFTTQCLIIYRAKRSLNIRHENRPFSLLFVSLINCYFANSVLGVDARLARKIEESTPLYNAARNGHEEVARILLDTGGNG